MKGDIYSEGKLAGRGGWTWYTGSSSWLYEAQTSYILGLKIYHGKLTIKPCVPKSWEKFETTLKWKNAIYHIKYSQVGEYKIVADSKLQINDNSAIELKEAGEYEIQVYF